ncbi:hypothetical protein CIB93_34800, partial [Streptomyces sp. WZ.A104]
MPRTTADRPAGNATTDPHRNTPPDATTPTPAAPASTRAVDALPWEELVTSALLGTDRRPPVPQGAP